MWNKIRKVVDDRKITVLYETYALELVQAPSREVIGVIAGHGGASVKKGKEKKN